MTPLIILLLAALFGLLFGSFINLAIYRIPRGETIVRGRSYCPHCGQKISWYDNIPILSFLILRGSCRHCEGSISLRYPLVELLCGALLALAAYRWVIIPDSPQLVNLLVASFVLLLSVAVFFIDLEFSIIPNLLSYPFILIGLLAGLFSHYPLSGGSGFFQPEKFWSALFGFLVGGIVFLLLALVSAVIYGRPALGMGDVKLVAGYGAWFGIDGALFVIITGSILGAIVGSSIMFLTGRSLRNEIPFGPFLCLAAAVYLFIGPEIIDWYLGFYGVVG